MLRKGPVNDILMVIDIPHTANIELLILLLDTFWCLHFDPCAAKYAISGSMSVIPQIVDREIHQNTFIGIPLSGPHRYLVVTIGFCTANWTRYGQTINKNPMVRVQLLCGSFLERMYCVNVITNEFSGWIDRR